MGLAPGLLLEEGFGEGFCEGGAETGAAATEPMIPSPIAAAGNEKIARFNYNPS